MLSVKFILVYLIQPMGGGGGGGGGHGSANKLNVYAHPFNVFI